MDPEEEFAQQRQRNRTVYAIEDFYDAHANLSYPAVGNLLLAVATGAGWFFGAENQVHFLAAASTGIGLLLIRNYAPLAKISQLYTLLLAYFLAVILEYAFFGLPEPIFPHFTVAEGWVGFAPFANSLFPVVYAVLRLGLGYALINLYLKNRKVRLEPLSVVRLLDRDLAGKLE